jgi:hypothetical protein
MSDQTRQREFGDPSAAALPEEEGAEGYRRAQAQASDGRPGTVERSRPLEFDESGFPIAQRNPSFVTRVARLLAQ